MSELVVDARVLVYRVIVGISNTAELPTLDARLRGASALLAPSSEFLRSHRILNSLARDGDITPSEAMRMSMLVCESGVELRPLWPWDIPRISTLNCHPSDAWCIAVAESVGVTFVTRNAALQSLDTACPIEVY